jgi:hypothetical protein
MAKLLVTREEIDKRLDKPNKTDADYEQLYIDMFGKEPETYGRHWPDSKINLIIDAIYEEKPFSFKPFPKGIDA